jgi:hypothetical protein
LGDEFGAFGVGVQAVGKEVEAVVENRRDINDAGAGLGGHGPDGGVEGAADGPVDGGVGGIGGHGGQGAEEEARGGGQGLEAFDEAAEIAGVAVVKIGEGEVIDAEHDDDDIGVEGHGVAAGLGGGPGAEGDAGDGGGAVDAEIAGDEAAVGEAVQDGGIGVAEAVVEAVAVGDTVADAGDAQGGGGGSGHDGSEEDEDKQAAHGETVLQPGRRVKPGDREGRVQRERRRVQRSGIREIRPRNGSCACGSRRDRRGGRRGARGR